MRAPVTPVEWLELVALLTVAVALFVWCYAPELAKAYREAQEARTAAQDPTATAQEATP